MPFSESMKQSVKEKADFTCCWCKDRLQKVEIHHIEPQASGGSDDESNAAPLCSNCHTSYGNNPDLKKEIRSRRDRWYRQVEEGVQIPHISDEGGTSHPSLHGVFVRLLRTWDNIRTPLTIEYSREIEDLNESNFDEPISRVLDELAELFDLKQEVSAFIRFVESDLMIPFRRAYRRMARETGKPETIVFEGIVGHNEKPMIFTSYHDVGLNLLIVANSMLNLPYTIKSVASNQDGESGPRLAEIIAMMEIEATYLNEDEFDYIEFYERGQESNGEAE